MTTTEADERERSALLQHTTDQLRESVKTHQPAHLGPSQAEALLLLLGAQAGALAASKEATARHKAASDEARREAAGLRATWKAATFETMNVREQALEREGELRRRLDQAQARIIDLEREARECAAVEAQP